MADSVHKARQLNLVDQIELAIAEVKKAIYNEDAVNIIDWSATVQLHANKLQTTSMPDIVNRFQTVDDTV